MDCRIRVVSNLQVKSSSTFAVRSLHWLGECDQHWQYHHLKPMSNKFIQIWKRNIVRYKTIQAAHKMVSYCKSLLSSLRDTIETIYFHLLLEYLLFRLITILRARSDFSRDYNWKSFKNFKTKARWNDKGHWQMQSKLCLNDCS